MCFSWYQLHSRSILICCPSIIFIFYSVETREDIIRFWQLQSYVNLSAVYIPFLFRTLWYLNRSWNLEGIAKYTLFTCSSLLCCCPFQFCCLSLGLIKLCVDKWNFIYDCFSKKTICFLIAFVFGKLLFILILFRININGSSQ